jgi:hypothetical protein
LKKTLILLVFLLFPLFITPFSFQPAFASAGRGHVSTNGGSGNGGRSGTSGYTSTRGRIHHYVTPAEFITTLIIVLGGLYLVGKKQKNSELPVLGFSTRIKNETRGSNPGEDAFWADKNLKARIETCFSEIQKAWSEQNPEAAAAYMSEGLLLDHKRLIQEMTENNERQIVSGVKVNLIKAMYVSPDRESFRVTIYAHMYDFLEDTQTKEVISGEKDKKRRLEEKWYFIKKDGQWVVDRIYGS